MRHDHLDTLARQWTLLRLIPRHPQAISTTDALARLREAGFRCTRRTVERDLYDFAGRFPIQVDDRSRPQGWSFIRNAAVDFLPRLTTEQAVALMLAKEHVTHMLPRGMQRDLKPLFDAAARELATTGWKDWHQRTAYASPTLILRPPKIDAKVLTDVQHAIAHGVQLAARYRSKGKAPGTDMRAHPLGMLVRGPLHILVCTLGDDTQVHQLDVHKLTATRLLDARRSEPAGFDFQAYATGDLAFASHGPIRMKLRFDGDAGAHLRDALLSDDQTWTECDDGSVVVEATKEDDRQLLWWIFSFGGRVEVLEPGSLRKRVLAELRRAVGVYGEGS